MLRALMVKHDVAHRYVEQPAQRHAWNSGWIPTAIEFLVNEEIRPDHPER